MEWFEDWFNTEEYLYVYRHRNEADARLLVDLILKNINPTKEASVLDMACGAGRHSILLAKKNFDVTAVDLSQNLLNVAKNAAADAGVEVNFIRSDLRRFSIDIHFDLVLNLFTSFGYFEEDEENFKILRNVYYHLKSPGYFVLDYFNVRYVEKNLVKFSRGKIPGGEIIQERRIEDGRSKEQEQDHEQGKTLMNEKDWGKRVIKNITVRKNNTERYYMESVRMFRCYELIKELKDIGFDILKTFGDFNGNSFDSENSPRIIIIAGR